jgi:co-chaperonin GroES (HSP10)
MTPLGNKILVDPFVVKEQTTESGLVLLPSERDILDKGTVVAVSPDIASPSVTPGSIVLYEKNAGVQVEGGRLMDYSSIVAKLDS